MQHSLLMMGRRGKCLNVNAHIIPLAYAWQKIGLYINQKSGTAGNNDLKHIFMLASVGNSSQLCLWTKMCVCICTKLLPRVGYRSVSATFPTYCRDFPSLLWEQTEDERVCESKRKREGKREKVRCLYKLFILTHTDLYGMTPITDLYTHALSFTHTHAQFAFHSWNAICESPTASTLHRQHYSTVLTVRPCRKYREKERARQEEGKWRRAESRWGKEDNSTLAVFLT